MSPKPKRGRADYKKRLKKEFPEIHADLRAGKYASVTEAAIAAGIKERRDRLDDLKAAWTKASRGEQDAFLAWLGGTALPQPQSQVKAAVPSSPSFVGPRASTIAAGRYLLPHAAARVENIMIRRKMKPADIMAEMGFDKRDASLGRALINGSSLRLAVIAALETWIAENDKP
ncbi:hypothetical protein [Rhizobium sp. NRK18]|uniref:hypothetical protein n=1 Tax=Rhizobium sp. NRK18 TaxID=2964667 RepID=UPI0021C449AB|nr:hypothetical protein [Rhizobium sp. NRK18]MCQ2002378.1 hypothetical protein [Rhizobium sp. NRK18]